MTDAPLPGAGPQKQIPFREPTFAGTAGSIHIAAGQLADGRRLLQACLAKTQADLDRAVSHQFLAWATTPALKGKNPSSTIHQPE